MKKVSMAVARARFPEVVKAAEDGETVVVGRYGHPVAVVLSFERFEQMEEDIEDLKAMLRMELEIARTGERGPTLEEVMAERGQPEQTSQEPAGTAATARRGGERR